MATWIVYELRFSGDDPTARVEALTLAASRMKRERLQKIDTSVPTAPVALRVTIQTPDESSFDEAIAPVVPLLEKGAFHGGAKLADGTRVALRIARGLTFRLVISGDTPAARADALNHAAARMKTERLHEIDTSVATDSVVLRVTITHATGDACFDHAIGTAVQEIAGDIAEAGWNVTGGASAQIENVRKS